jgi:3'-5' exoribonuclease
MVHNKDNIYDKHINLKDWFGMKNEKDFVENLKDERDIKSKFAVANKIIKTSAKGRKYLDITLTDKTGQIDGRMFPEKVETVHESINLGSIYEINGRISEFPAGSSKFNMVINVLNELSEGEYMLDDFVMTSENNTEELDAFISSTINGIKTPPLKNLLESFFCDKKFTEQFYRAPAAMVHHHNYIGGLLDHTVEVLKICQATCEIFPELDEDLLYTGALLHDVGKIRTYIYANGPIGFSQEGELLDHLYISCEMVKERIEKLETPQELSNQILHMILSHHGYVINGWGSPVDPKTPEAVALHHADNMDAKIKEML